MFWLGSDLLHLTAACCYISSLGRKIALVEEMIWSEVGLCSAATLVWLARPSHLTSRGTKGKGYC